MIKKRIGVLVIALTIILSGCTQESFISEGTIEDAINTLASEEFKGRLTGTDGNDKAVEYIADRFEKMGLTPFNDTSYYHEYKQAVFDPDKAEHSFIINYKDGSTRECTYGVDYVDQLRVNNIDITCPITFDPNDVELDKKLIVLEENENLSSVRDAAKAVLVKSNDFFMNTSIRNDDAPIIRISEKLYDEMENEDIENISIISKYVEEEITAKNVVGKITGTDSNKALVLSAHLDHVGWAGETIFHGAVDNASGTAVLLDVVKKLIEYSKGNSFNMDIIICAFNGEEYGLRGSNAFVEKVKAEYNELYNVNIDCIGKMDGGRIALDNTSGVNSKLIDEIKESLRKYEIEYVDQFYGTSDHQSFIDNNLCGISIGQEDLSSGNSVHTEKDTIENINLEYLKKISDVIYDFIVNNDGIIFKLDRISSSSTNKNIDIETEVREEWEKITQKAEEIRKEKDLQYDEIIDVEADGYFWHISGNRPLVDIKEINKYYQEMVIPEEVLEYKFFSIYISDSNSGTSVHKERAIVKNELGKICKRDLNLEIINRVLLKYENDGSTLEIIIETPVNNNLRYSRLDFCDIEQIDVNGNKYILLKTKGKDEIQGIYREHSIDDQKYPVEIRKIEEVILESKVNEDPTITYIYNNTKEEMIEAVKQIDIEEIIKGLGI